MPKAIRAIITPKVLKWARTLDSISVDYISKKMKIKPEKILEWEDGTTYPTLAQAKKLANQYRIPFAYFYLPDVPKKIKRIEKVDYRTFSNIGEGDFMSRELSWFLRDIEERRDIAIELYNKEKIKPKEFITNCNINSSVDDIANTIRSIVGLTWDNQKKFRKPEVALSYCIARLEEKDVLIFQATKINPEEMRGLSFAYDYLPIIALNRKDEKSARLFTLFHELVHIITKTSGICNDMSENKHQKRRIELLCNKIAGCALVPEDLLKESQQLSSIRKYGVDDSYVEAIARNFAVSREVIINRLWNINVISEREYFNILKRYSNEYLAHNKKSKKNGFISPALDKETQVGKLYAKKVLAAYYADKISPREASGYLLGLRLQHFRQIESLCYK